MSCTDLHYIPGVEVPRCIVSDVGCEEVIFSLKVGEVKWGVERLVIVAVQKCTIVRVVLRDLQDACRVEAATVPKSVIECKVVEDSIVTARKCDAWAQ